ncbi:MAG: GNAT family N-acetyltransferase, partial [Pseudorhizobium sp.]
LLEALVDNAIRAGRQAIRLETGIYQPQAIGLYRAYGFIDIPPFGSYGEDPLSIFMEKRLS